MFPSSMSFHRSLLLYVALAQLLSFIRVASGFIAWTALGDVRRKLDGRWTLSVGATSAKEKSSELIELLTTGERKDHDTQSRMSSLVDELIAMETSFDPTECLDGPLFVSHVISGPTPLWESLGIGPSKTNIQGQQYIYNDVEKSVINYAEVLGSSFHLRAYGTYAKDESATEPAAGSGPKPGLVPFLLPMRLRGASVQCPADFVVTVTRACFSVLGRELNVPISGTGYLRVLYADPSLRIFVSPKSTSDDRWEKAGLIVAQVRVDLCRPHFERLE